MNRRTLLRASLASVMIPAVARAQSTPIAGLSLDAYQLAWEQPITSRYPSTPVVYEDELHVSSDRGLVQLNLGNGEIAREMDLGFNPGAPLIDAYGHTIIGTGITREGTYVPPYAISREAWDLTWTADEAAYFSTPVSFGFGVAVLGDDATLRVLNAVTGAVEWTYPLESHARGIAVVPPTSDLEVPRRLITANETGQVFSFVFADDALYALDWMTNLRVEELWWPVLFGETLVVGNGDTVWALDVETGAIRWQHRHDAHLYHSPAIDDTQIVLTAEIDGRGALIVLDVGTGDQIAQVDLPASPYFLSSGAVPVTIHGEQLIATLPLHGVVAIDRTLHEITGELRTEEVALRTPAVIADDLLILRATDGRVFAYQTRA